MDVDVNTSSNKTNTDNPVEQRWIINNELANLRADLDDLISRIPDLSDVDLENAKEKLMEKIAKEKVREATDGSAQIAPGIESGGHGSERASADLPVVLHGANFEGLLGFLRVSYAGVSILSPKRFGEALSIDIQTLAKQAHVHRNTISRAPESESVQRFLREALRVLRAAVDVSHDMEHAIFWYRNDPLPLFGYKTAEQLVAEGRTEDLLRYIESLEAGPAG